MLYKHALRNALEPVVAVLGAAVPYLVGGAVLIESIFGIRGIGALSFESILSRDYNAIMGLAVVTSLATLSASLAADLVQMSIDPRIGRAGARPPPVAAR